MSIVHFNTQKRIILWLNEWVSQGKEILKFQWLLITQCVNEIIFF